jgi:hypothetical protein
MRSRSVRVIRAMSVRVMMVVRDVFPVLVVTRHARCFLLIAGTAGPLVKSRGPILRV